MRVWRAIMKTLLTLKQISCEAFPISTLRKLAGDINSDFPAFKIGKKWVVYQEDYYQWLDKQKEENLVSSPLKENQPQTALNGGDVLYE
jgi:hypothetical protein